MNMLQDHPTFDEMEAFLQDGARPGHAARNAKILRHLLANCGTCRNQLELMGWTRGRLERLVYLPGGISRSGTDNHQAEKGYSYEIAFSRAEHTVADFLTVAPPPSLPLVQLLEELDQSSRESHLRLVEEDEKFASPHLVQPLIDRSHAAR